MAAVLIVLGAAVSLVGAYLLGEWPAVVLAVGIMLIAGGVDEAWR